MLRRRSILLLLFLTVPVWVHAQTDDPIFEEFQFNFATPGARANAMGRAFIGLADDATAAESNPAGLVNLTKPEVSFEFKSTDFTVERAAFADSFVNGTTADFGQTSNSPAFASFVYPHQRWRFSFFRHEYFNYQEEFSLEQRSVPNGRTLTAETTTSEFSGVNYGVAAAYQVSTQVFLGASIKASQLDVETLRIADAFGAEISNSDTGISLTLGALINPNERVSVGVIYEANPKFEYVEETNIIGDFDVALSIPDRFGVGVSFAPTDTLTLLADVVFVRYSELVDDFTVIIFQREPEDFALDNATEFHFGAEQVLFVGDNLFAIRGGFFTNPAHDLEYVGALENETGVTVDALFNFGERDTDLGITVGGGFTFQNLFQVDAAYLFSDSFNEFSVSAVVRF